MSTRPGAPTVFLSYGRADATAFVAKLHDDLAAAGFRIWQDRTRIGVGTPWDESIEAGLRESHVLLAVLTPHAVRRATDRGSPDGQDSVCLDEIAYARGVCRIPIVPVRLAPCTTPLLIYRLHAVDMTRWRESAPVYAAGFAELSAYLRAVLAGERRERVDTRTFASWDFSPFLLEKRRGFVGRDWLFHEIDAWRRGPGASALVITGDPGSGKSAVVAELVAMSPGGQVLGYHCCQADTPATLDPARFVRSLAAMIAARLDAFAALLDEPGAQEALAESRAAADPGGAFEGGILAPLSRLSDADIRGIAPDGAAYLLVDALDEALVHGHGPSIVDVVASRLGRLPAWLRLVATTRNDRRVLQRLAGLHAQVVRIDTAQNAEDVRGYVTRVLSTSLLRQQLATAGHAPARVAEELLQASGGNFLFVTTAIDAMRAGELDVAQLRTLPPGLAGLYGLFFGRLCPEGDPMLAGAKVVLQVLACAREPLSRTQLAAITGLDPDDELPDLLSRLSAFAPVREGHYTLFHRSLFDWLTGWDATLDVPVAGRFFANPKKGHARLAAWGWDEYRRGVHTASPYTFRHLPQHLAGADRIDELLSLLTDWRFIEAMVQGGRGAGTTVFDLVRDLAMAVARGEGLPAAHAGRRRASLLVEAIRFDAQLVAGHPTALFQCCWNRCWWYDCAEAAHFFEADGEGGVEVGGAPWRQPGEKLHTFMEAWRAEKERETPGFVWLRALRPPPETIGGAQRAVLQAHLKGSIHLALSPDAARLASGGEGGSVRLWDMASGAPIASFDIDAYEPNGSVVDVAFTPAADQLIVTGNRTVFVLRGDTLGEEAAVGLPGALVVAAALSPNGRRLALGHFDGELRLVDVTARLELCLVKVQGDRVEALAFSPDGSMLASGGEAGAAAVQLWHVREDGLHEQMRFADDASVEALAFSPDCQALVWSNYTGRVTYQPLGDGASWSIETSDGKPAPVSCLAFAPDGTSLFYGAGDAFGDVEPEIGVLDLAARDIVRRLHGHSSMVLDVRPYRGGRALVTAGHDSTIRLWSLEDRVAAVELPWWERRVQTVAFSPDGRRSYTGSAASTAVVVRALDTGEFLAHYPDHDRGTHRLAVSHDGRRLFAADVAGVIRVWPLDVDAPPAIWPSAAAQMRELRVSPDDRVLALVTFSGLLLLDAGTGDTLLGAASSAGLEHSQFSADGGFVAAIGMRHIVVVDLRARALVGEFSSEEAAYGAVCAFADDDRTLVYEGLRGRPGALDVRTGSARMLTDAHRAALDRARPGHDSPVGWGIGAPSSSAAQPESQRLHEMALGLRATGAPIAWLPLSWTHAIAHHPSGRCWALERYGQLWIVRIEGDLQTPGARQQPA